RGGPEPRVRAVPAPGRTPGAEGRDDVRRRAADARHRPGDDGPAEDPPARRVVDGHIARAHRAHLRDDRGDQPAGHDDPAGRAERELRAGGFQARLRAGDGPRGDVGQLGRAPDQPRSAEGIPRHMTTLLALIGAKALVYLYIWLLSAIAASYLSDRKGDGEKSR